MENKEANIEILICECIKGNTLAQDKLFRSQYSLVMSVCRRYSRNKEEANEMLNDCFFRMFRNMDKYDNTYPFSPWLRKLCVNCCLRYLEKYTKKIRFEMWDNQSVDTRYEEIELPDALDHNYLLLLDDLPLACKTVANLYVFEGYKHSEIAEQLNISVGTSKSNLHRAKKLLFAILERQGKYSIKRKNNYGG